MTGNKVWRKFTFAALTTSKIRVLTNASISNDGYSRLTEVEAYEASQTAANDSVQWIVTDHLGTPRMVADLTGSLAGIKRHDYLPFGEEIGDGVGGRISAQGYVGDNVRQQFTGYEKDNETGLDYAEARYYASTQGRFTSVDPLQSSGRLAMPQSLNRYAYVLNNPLALTDPTGLMACPPNKKCLKDESGTEYYEGEDGDPVYTVDHTDKPPATPIAPILVLPITITIQTSLRLPPFLIGTGIVVIGWGLGDAIANPRQAPYRHRDGGISTTAGAQAYPVDLGLPPLFTTPITLPAPPAPMEARKRDLDLVDHVADKYGVDRYDLGRAVEEAKEGLGRYKGRRAPDLTKKEIEQLAKELPKKKT